MTETDAPTRGPLTRDTIVRAAVALADEDGVKGLTMRKLAQSVGYEVMSLYNHVANKRELLDLIVDAAASEVVSPEDSLEPMAAVRAIALSLREALVNHPWAPELWLSQIPGPHRSRVMEDLLRSLDRSDLPPELAHHGFHAVINHVVGYTIQQLGMASVPGDPEQVITDYLGSLSPEDHALTIAHVHQHIDGDTSSSFELVLDLILDGLVGLAAQN